jgi:hypothetical protein
VHNEELCSLYYSQDFIRVGISKSGAFVQKVQEEIVNEFVNYATSIFLIVLCILITSVVSFHQQMHLLLNI